MQGLREIAAFADNQSAYQCGRSSGGMYNNAAGKSIAPQVAIMPLPHTQFGVGAWTSSNHNAENHKIAANKAPSANGNNITHSYVFTTAELPVPVKDREFIKQACLTASRKMP